MARKYANILTAIWRKEEFRALTAEEQRVYLQLTSQPDISAAGVLPLSLTRWSAQARNTTPATVMAAIEGLARGRFVMYDTRTEELLVRSFIRWDGGYTNSKRKPVIREAVQEVESPMIRRALAAELRRLGLPDWLPDALPDSPSDTTPDPGLDEEPRDIAEKLSAQGNRPSDSPSDAVSPSERVVVTKGPYLDPQPPTLNPQAAPSVPAPQDLSNRDRGLFSMEAGHPEAASGIVTEAPSGKAPTVNQRSRLITNAYAEAEPMCRWVAVNGIVKKAMQANRWTDDAIREALLRMAKEGRTVTVESLRIELDGLPPRNRASPRNGLVEREGLLLKPETAARIDDRARFAAMDAAANTTPAIEGPT